MKKVILFLVGLPFQIINIYYKLKNRDSKKILIYTDSRGIEITKTYNRKNPFSSYIGFFMKHYNVDFVIMPKSHTTLIDFLYEWESKYKKIKYDYVIIHLGIVDFSPRPLSMLEEVHTSKQQITNYLFENSIEKLNKNDLYVTKYDGEYTSSLYSKFFLENHIITKLHEINNLIFIGSNKVLENWNGNYSKKRPDNINIIQEYNRLIIKNLQHTIDISHWDETEIRRYTVDNIHLSSVGFKYIENELKKLIIEENK